MSFNNYHNRDLGRMGEDLACEYLKSNNYEVLDRNYRTRYGEIDIIALYRKEEVVVIEVKTRLSINKGRGAENVDVRKLKKIVMVAKKYAYEKRLLSYRLRFDVIEVNLNDLGYSSKKDNTSNRCKIKINHIKNVLI